MTTPRLIPFEEVRSFLVSIRLALLAQAVDRELSLTGEQTARLVQTATDQTKVPQEVLQELRAVASAAVSTNSIVKLPAEFWSAYLSALATLDQNIDVLVGTALKCSNTPEESYAWAMQFPPNVAFLTRKYLDAATAKHLSTVHLETLDRTTSPSILASRRARANAFLKGMRSLLAISVRARLGTDQVTRDKPITR